MSQLIFDWYGVFEKWATVYKLKGGLYIATMRKYDYNKIECSIISFPGLAQMRKPPFIISDSYVSDDISFLSGAKISIKIEKYISFTESLNFGRF